MISILLQMEMGGHLLLSLCLRNLPLQILLLSNQSPLSEQWAWSSSLSCFIEQGGSRRRDNCQWRYRLRKGNFWERVDTSAFTRKAVNQQCINLGWELETLLNCCSSVVLKQPPRHSAGRGVRSGWKTKFACSGGSWAQGSMRSCPLPCP